MLFRVEVGRDVFCIFFSFCFSDLRVVRFRWDGYKMESLIFVDLGYEGDVNFDCVKI